MLIGKKYKVEVQGLDLVLSERAIVQRGKNTGKEAWHDIGYFASIEGIINHLTQKHVRESQLTDLKTVLKAINDLREVVRAIPRVPVIVNKAD